MPDLREGGSVSSGQQHTLQHHRVDIFADGKRHRLYTSNEWAEGCLWNNREISTLQSHSSWSYRIIGALQSVCGLLWHKWNAWERALEMTETSVSCRPSAYALTELLEPCSQSANCSDTNDSTINLRVAWTSFLVDNVEQSTLEYKK